jgi:beta-glucanase (GH16 family)
MVIFKYAFAATCLAVSSLPALSENSTLAPSSNGFVETFSERLSEDDWYFASYDQPKNFIATKWRTDMISQYPSNDPERAGTVVLSLAPNPESDSKAFVGAELQRAGKYGYGDYEVYMQAAKGDGILSSFFTYTGPPFGDPHDEIDFEILGRDTTRVCVNHFVDGESLPRPWADLGFDAADGPNLYRFEWRKDRITWFVNGTQIYQLTDKEAPIPSHSSKIMMNIWAGNEGQYNWLKKPDPDTRVEARYHCVSFRPEGSEEATCSDFIAGSAPPK